MSMTLEEALLLAKSDKEVGVITTHAKACVVLAEEVTRLTEQMAQFADTTNMKLPS